MTGPIDPTYADSAYYTPQTLARKRALAESMLKTGTEASPISSPWQGLARLANAGFGGLELGMLDTQERQQNAKDAALVSQLFGGSAQPALSTPAAAPAAAPATAPSPTGGYATKVAMAESGGNPTETNPKSSATGSGQFIDSTWLDLMNKYHPEMTKGKSPQEVLALRTDPKLSNELITDYAHENAKTLQAAGIEPTEGTLYAAHVFGPGGVIALSRAAPNAPAAGIVGPQVMAANPWIGNRTAQDLLSFVGGKMAPPAGNEISPMATPGAVPSLQAASRLAVSGNPRYAAIGNAIISKSIASDMNVPPELKEYAFYQKQAIASGQRPISYSDWDLQRRTATASKTNINMGENKLKGALGEGIGKQIITGYQGAQDAVRTLQTNQEVIKLVDSGIFTGPTAKIRTELGSALQKLGFNYFKDPVANTQAFVGVSAQNVGRLIKQYGSGTGLSDADREFATRQAGGDPDLSEAGIRRIIELNDKAARNLIRLNNAQVEKLPKDAIPFDMTIGEPAPMQAQGGAPTAAPKAAAADILQQAKDAIAQGAPRDAVIKRLRDMGIDTGGL